MPTISAMIRRARDFKTCANCYKSIAPKTQYVRAYGYGMEGDKPYAIAIHIECAGTETREKIRGKSGKNG